MSGAKRSGCPTLVGNHDPEHQSTERFRDEAELRTRIHRSAATRAL